MKYAILMVQIKIRKWTINVFAISFPAPVGLLYEQKPVSPVSSRKENVWMPPEF